MSIEVKIIKHTDAGAFETELQTAMNDGFEIFSTHVVGELSRLYCAIVKRHDSGTRMETASLIEVTRKHAAEIRRLKNRIEVLEDTADDDTPIDERAYNFVPLRSIHVIDSLTREDTVDEEIERELIARQILKDGK